MAVYIGIDVLTTGMKLFFEKFAMSNAELADFLDCLDTQAKKLGKEGLQIKRWAEHWLTTAGANDVTAKMQDGKIVIMQSYPEIGDKVYHSQQLKLWVTGQKDGERKTKTIDYKMEE